MPTAITCPHCRKQFAFVAELAGTQVECPHCQRSLRMPEGDTKGPPLPPAVKNIAAPVMEMEPVVDTSRPYRPRFHAREYAGLRILQMVFYVVAGLCGAGFVLAEVLVIGGGMSVYNSASTPLAIRDDAPPELQAQLERAQESMRSATRGAALAAILVPQVFLIFGFGLPALLCVAAGQLIGLLIDVQTNTQEAAHYLRHLEH